MKTVNVLEYEDGEVLSLHSFLLDYNGVKQAKACFLSLCKKHETDRYEELMEQFAEEERAAKEGVANLWQGDESDFAGGLNIHLVESTINA